MTDCTASQIPPFPPQRCQEIGVPLAESVQDKHSRHYYCCYPLLRPSLVAAADHPRVHHEFVAGSVQTGSRSLAVVVVVAVASLGDWGIGVHPDVADNDHTGDVKPPVVGDHSTGNCPADLGESNHALDHSAIHLKTLHSAHCSHCGNDHRLNVFGPWAWKAEWTYDTMTSVLVFRTTASDSDHEDGRDLAQNQPPYASILELGWRLNETPFPSDMLMTVSCCSDQIRIRAPW